MPPKRVITVTFANALVQLPVSEVQHLLKRLGVFGPVPQDLEPLRFEKWDLPASVKVRVLSAPCVCQLLVPVLLASGRCCLVLAYSLLVC